MSATSQRPPDAEALELDAGGLFVHAEAGPELTAAPHEPRHDAVADGSMQDLTDDSAQHSTHAPPTLGALYVGARLILRCRKEWRAAAVAAFEIELGRVVLSVASPSGHTYRVRRPLDSILTHDGPLPVLGEGTWRACFARYDIRW